MADAPARSALGAVSLAVAVVAVGIPVAGAIAGLALHDPTRKFDFGPLATALFAAAFVLPVAGVAGLVAVVLGTVDRRLHRPQYWFGGLAVGLGALVTFPGLVVLVYFGFIA